VHTLNFESLRSFWVVIFSLSLIPLLVKPLNVITVLLTYLVSLIATLGILYVAKAYKHTEISLLSPLDNLKPAFVALISFFFLGEILKIQQIVGISILVISAYLLESDHHFSNLIAPLKHILKSKYPLYFLFATLLFAISSIIEKYIINSNAINIYTLFFLVWVFIAVNFNIIHISSYGFKDTIECFKQTKSLSILVALFSIFANILVYKSLSLANVSLVMSFLTISTFLIVLLGGKFFNEKYLYFRIIVSTIMLVGAILVII
jgi:uncharacterized membrane protein